MLFIIAFMISLTGIFIWAIVAKNKQYQSSKPKYFSLEEAIQYNRANNVPGHMSVDGGKTWVDECEYREKNPGAGGSGGFGWRDPDGTTHLLDACKGEIIIPPTPAMSNGVLSKSIT